MTRRDLAGEPAAGAIPKSGEGEPVFAEPWQAEAFALAVRLQADGHFTAREWAEALGAEIKAAQARGEPDDGSTYYSHWLAALRRVLEAKGLIAREEVETRKSAWAEAYARTPHGRPVELTAPGARGDAGEAD